MRMEADSMEKDWCFCNLGTAFQVWKNGCGLEECPRNATPCLKKSSNGRRMLLNLVVSCVTFGCITLQELRE